MSITIGWWAIPAAMTLALAVWIILPERETGYGAAIAGAFQLMGGIIIVLLSWLIWSLAA